MTENWHEWRRLSGIKPDVYWREKVKTNERGLSRESIWFLKGIAVIAIVSCHCTHVVEEASRLNQAIRAFYESWHGLGVPVFYFLAGYLFHREENRFVFFKKKIKSILIPWTFTGTIVWLYIVLRKGNLSVMSWFNFVFAKGNYLYFLTDLIFFYIIFYFLLNKPNLQKWLFGILVVFYILGQKIGLSFENNIASILNIVNLMYFFLGIIYRNIEYTPDERLCLLYGIMFVFFRLPIPWGMFGVIKSLAGIMTWILFWTSIRPLLARYLNVTDRILCYFGKHSFSIYLLHMPIAGIVANLLNRSEIFAPLTLFRPFIVIGITLIGIWIWKKITRMNKWGLILIGYR